MSPRRAPRPAGRRVARPVRSGRAARAPLDPARRRLAWFAAVVVLATGGAVAVAGTSSRPTGVDEAASRAGALGRDYSCAGGIPGGRAYVGQAGGTTAEGSGITADGRVAGGAGGKGLRIGTSPVHVQAEPDSAAAAYALRAASSPRWLAASACPEPRAEWWFVGAGGSSGHDSVLVLDNPREGDALVDVEVAGPRGAVETPGLRDLRIASGHALRLDLAKYAPAVGDLAVHVSASRGLVAASAPESWSAEVVAKPAREWVAAQPAARRRTTLVGLARGPDRAVLLVANPSAREAVVRVELVGERGTFTPTGKPSVTVPPQTVVPVDLDADLDAHPLALRVRSQVPVTATVRSVAGTDEAYASAGDALGSASVAGVPPGAPATLVLVSDGAAAAVQVTGFAADGKQVSSKRLAVPARGAARYELGAKVRTVRVQGAGRDVSGALSLGGRRTIASIALSPGASRALVPVVRPGW